MSRNTRPTDTYLGLTDPELLDVRGDGRRQLFRRKLWERDKGLCGICQESVELTEMDVDHILPKFLGGADDWSNLRPAHTWCNRGRHRQEFAHRERVFRGDEAIAVTVRFPRETMDRIRAQAAAEDRSLNWYLVHIISRGLGM